MTTARLCLAEGRVKLVVRKAEPRLWGGAPGKLVAPVTKDTRHVEGSLDALIAAAGVPPERVKSNGAWSTQAARARFEARQQRAAAPAAVGAPAADERE